MKTRYLLLLVAASSGLGSCTKPPDAGADATRVPDSRYIEDSRPIIESLQTALAAELGEAIRDGGPVEGIEVCSQMAQKLTEGVAEKYPQTDIRRTALRVRNPANAPDAHSAEILERWTASTAATRQKPEPEIREEADAVILHFPIMTGSVCLDCHGDPDTFEPELSEKLSELYPRDEATGFAEGELRGAFRLVLDKTK